MVLEAQVLKPHFVLGYDLMLMHNRMVIDAWQMLTPPNPTAMGKAPPWSRAAGEARKSGLRHFIVLLLNLFCGRLPTRATALTSLPASRTSLGTSRLLRLRPM